MSPQRIVRVSALVAAAGLMLQPTFGQGRGGGAGGGTAPGAGAGAGASPSTGANPGIPSTPTRPPTTQNPTTQPSQQPTQQQQPIFVSGRVLLEDGNPPTESVVIERVCSGSARAEGYTDSRGYFSLQLGMKNNGILQDASEEMGGFGASSAAGGGGFGGNPMGASNSGMRSMGTENRYMDCDLRARLAGYRSQSVSLANRRPMDPPDIGTILMHRLGPSEGSTISTVSLAAPKDARKAYEKGMDALKKKKPDDAVKNFEKAVELYPKYATAWYELGRLQTARGDSAGARQSFDSATKADSKFVAPYLEMAMIEWKAEKWQDVADLSAQVVKLDSFDYPQAHFLNALSNYYLKNMDVAEKSAREAARLDTRHQFVTNVRLLGVILAQKQDYTGAAEQFKSYLQLAPQASDAATVRGQLTQLEQMQSSAKQ